MPNYHLDFLKIVDALENSMSRFRPNNVAIFFKIAKEPSNAASS